MLRLLTPKKDGCGQWTIPFTITITQDLILDDDTPISEEAAMKLAEEHLQEFAGTNDCSEIVANEQPKFE